MANNGGRIDYSIGFKVDEAGLTKARQQLEELGSMSATQLQKLNPSLSMGQARVALQNLKESVVEIHTAMDSAFDTTTGVMNLQQLQSNLKNLDLNRIRNSFNQAGEAGRSAFLNVSKAALTTNVQLKQTDSLLDRMGQTLTNTIRWSISSNAINAFTGAVQQAWGYVQHLDTSLNDIRIVTNKSTEEMEKFAEKANEAAKSLGSSTTEYTEAALIYYQQGLSDEEAAARAETTLKAANVTGQTGRQVSEELTAVWNGYKVSAEETEEYVDKLAAVAATTASDLEELSTGMSKVASAANNMGVDIDQLNAQLATIVSVTRQAPESAGTALKTIYARIEDLKIGGEDESGVKLGDVSSTLDAVGVSIMDTEGNLRDLGEVIEEVASKWNTWTDAQQNAIAQAMAGKRQYNNLLALFDNWDMYTQALETSKNATGTLQRQQDIFMESTEAHLQKLQTQWEDLYDSLLDTKSINGLIDGLTKILDLATDVVDATGGLKGVLTGLVGFVGTTFSKQIGNAFGPMISNMNAAQQNARVLEGLLANINYQASTGVISGEAAKVMTETQQAMSQYWSVMSEEQINASQRTIQEIGEWADKKEAIESTTNAMKAYFASSKDSKANSIVADNDGTAKTATDFKASSTEVQYLIEKLNKANLNVKEIKNNTKDLTKSIRTAHDTTNLTNKDLDKISDKVQAVESNVKELGKRGLLDTTQVKKAQTLIQQIREEITKIQDPNSKKTNFTQGLIDDLTKLDSVSEGAKVRIQSYLDVLKNGSSTVEECEIAMQGLQESLNMANLRAQQTVQGISQLVGSLSSLYYGLNSLSNLGSIIADEDLDGLEKWSQSISAIVMGLPMLITGFSNLSSGLQNLTGTQSLSAALNSIWSSSAIGAAASSSGLTASLSGVTAGFTEAAGAAVLLETAIPILALITAAIIAVSAAVKKHQQDLENEAEVAKQNNEIQKERVVQAEEEKQKIDDLADSYEDLLSQREEDGALSKDQESKIYDLIKAYGDQDLIIQALSGDYDKLTDSIKKLQAAQNDEKISAYSKGLETAEAELTNTIIANAKSSERDKEGYDLSGLGGLDQHISFKKDLQERFGVSVDESGHIAWDDLNKLLTADSAALNNFLNEHQEDSEKAVNQIRSLLSENKTLIDEIKQEQNDYHSSLLDAVGYKYQEDIDNIKELWEYDELLNKLTEEASKTLKENNQELSDKEARDQGEQWARQFMSGQSEELANYDNASYIKDAVLDAFLPDENAVENRMKAIKDKLAEYSEGGNVDLTNRPKVTRREDSTLTNGDYETVQTTTYGNSATGYINFTPIIVDPVTNEYKGKLTPEDLDNYVAGVLSGEHDDYYNLQIGTSFETFDEANRAAIAYHELHEEMITARDEAESYEAYLSDIIGAKLVDLTDSQQEFIAGHIDLIKALVNDGHSVSDVFDILQKDLDTIEGQDHLVEIQAVLDENSEKKLQEKISDLFADTTIDMPFTESQFADFDEDEKLVALATLRDQETESIKEAWEANKIKYEEEQAALDKEIPKQQEKINNLKLEAEEEQKRYDQWKQHKLDEDLDLEKFDMLTAVEDTGFDTSLFNDDKIENFTEEYSKALEQLGNIYSQAEAEGQSFTDTLGNQWQELASQDIQKYVEALIQVEQKHGKADYGLEDIAKEWADNSKAVKKYTKELDSAEEVMSALKARQAEIADMDPENIDWSAQLDYTKEAIDAVNDSIDELQGSYQSLQDIIEDYNADGQLTLDNLQSLMKMDSEYVASLQLENGQLSLNEETYSNAISTKIDYLKYLALETLYEELNKIAIEGNIYANETFAASNVATTETIDAMSEAASRGKQALLELQEVKAAYSKSAEATNIAIDAYYNRLSMIDNVASQSTSSQLGKTDSSSSKSSSSSSESKPDEEDKLKISDIDIYKGINEELDKIESVLGRIQTIDDHSWGKSAIDALTKESKILETQLKTYREKAEMQEGDLASQRASLEEQGITFSNDGSTMTNASEKLKALYEEYNAMVDTYNAMSKTEQDEYKDTLEKKKDAIDDLEDAIDDYESLYSSYQDTLDSILEKQYEIIEKNVEAFNAEVEVHLELDEAKTEWNDFWYDVIKDVDDLDFSEKIEKSLANLKVLTGYGTKKTSDSQIGELTKHLTDTTSEVWKQINNAENGGAGSLFGSDTALSKETLTDYRDKLIDAVTSAKEAVDDIADTYLDMLDDAQDKIDKQVKGWEAIEDHINHNLSLIKLISGEKAYDSLAKQYDALYKNDMNLINTQKQSKDFWAGEISRYETLLANTEKGTKQWKTYTKALETATNNYRDAIKDLDSALESAIENVQSWRENQVNSTFERLDKAMSGGLGLDLVEEEWNLINNNASKYLDNVERAYSIEEYTLELDEAANAIGLSAENQAKLNAFRDEELTKLKEKDKLTQYDIDESRARLEIMKQEMALEDQKNNKSNMRLRRDSQGNYTYQYTGNDEDIEEAENAGLTARKEWYQLVKTRYTELSKDIIDIQKTQNDLLKEIDTAKLEGDIERENKLREMYESNEQYLVQMYAEAEKNKQDLVNGTAQYFAEVENAHILPQSEATVRTLIDQWTGSGKDSFLGAATSAIIELDNTQAEYVARTNSFLQEAGVNYQDLTKDGIDPTTEALNDLVDSNEEFAEKLEKVNEQLTTQEQNLKAAEEAYNNLKTAAAEAIEKANECLEKLSETSVKVKETVETNIQAVKNAATEAASAINSLSSAGSGSSGSSGSGGNSGNKPTAKVEKTTYGTYGLKVDGSYIEMYNGSASASDARTYFKNKYPNYNVYKTGGYTGDWIGDGGQPAILHKKELVLNESDTSNMLKAVDVVRDLVSNNSSTDISGIAESLVRAGSMQAQMLAQVGSGLLATMSSIVNNATSQNYSNNMTVNADFSGVRSADAIYQALRELENYGSQVAYSDAPISNKAY